MEGQAMLHDPTRHEALQSIAWDEGAAREAIRRIVSDTEARFSPDAYWPIYVDTPYVRTESPWTVTQATSSISLGWRGAPSGCASSGRGPTPRAWKKRQRAVGR
jgi:hypothetical protein